MAISMTIIVAVIAMTIIVWDSIDRFLNPVDIAFNQAILIAELSIAEGHAQENHNRRNSVESWT